MHDPPKAKQELRAALSQLLQETDTQNCLDLDQMTDYAQELLPDDQHARLRAHIVECPLCAATVADLRAAFRSVLILHRSLGGWLGPLLAFLRLLSPKLQYRWQMHKAHCTRCRTRTERLQAWLSPPVTMALGGAVAVLIFMTRSPHNPLPITPSKGMEQDVPKGGEPMGQPDITSWPTAVTVLEGYLYPTKNLDEIEKYWLKIVDLHPNSLAAHEALERIYRQRAEQAVDPRRKAGWMDRALAEKERLHELLSQE